MITERDPTPDERRRYARSFRLNAMNGAIFAVVFTIFGVVAIARGHRDLYDYAQFALALACLVHARYNWVRWQKYCE